MTDEGVALAQAAQYLATRAADAHPVLRRDLHEVDLSGAYLPEAKLIGVNPVMQISVDLT